MKGIALQELPDLPTEWVSTLPSKEEVVASIDTEQQQLLQAWISATECGHFTTPPPSITPHLVPLWYAHQLSYPQRRQLEEKVPLFSILGKIRNASWRWEWEDMTWPDLIAHYQALRTLSLGFAERYAERLDMTTGANPYGYSRFSRIFLDGVIGHLVYEKETPSSPLLVMGIIPLTGKRLLLGQVQLQRRMGRALFGLFGPHTPVEYCARRLSGTFPEHTIWCVEGKGLVAQNMANYKRCLRDYDEQLETMRSSPLTSKAVQATSIQSRDTLARQLEKLQRDATRIIAQYDSVKTWHTGNTIERLGRDFHEIDFSIPR